MNVSKSINLFYWSIVLITLTFNSQAQISTDDSLGTPAQALQGPDFTIGQDLGQRAGNNLFHSFQEFNINTGEFATFTGDPTIERVINRVTGGNISNIDGLMKSEMANADFFLVNPAGVMFGPSASININGSFNVSTADYLTFGDNDQFFSQPLENEILSADAPTAYGFLGADIGAITFDQSELSANEGEGISVIGSDIDASASRLEASAGTINIVSVESEGEVRISNSESGSIEFDVGSFTDFGEISLTDGTEINVDGEGDGAASIHAKNLTISDSFISARTEGIIDSAGVAIEVTDDFQLVRSLITTQSQSSGDAGNISIIADTLLIDGENAFGETGIKTSSIAITLIENIEVSLDISHDYVGDLTVGLFSPQSKTITFFSNIGGEGDNFTNTILSDDAPISITDWHAPFTGRLKPDESLSILEGQNAEGTWLLGIIDKEPEFDQGILNGWSLGINGREFVSTEVDKPIEGSSIVFSEVNVGSHQFNSPSNGGHITIEARTIDIKGNTVLDASGNTNGHISIFGENMVLDGSSIFARNNGIIDGRDIDIIMKGPMLDTHGFQIVNGGIIDTTTFGSGNGGNINITAKNILVDGQDSDSFTGIDAETTSNEGGGMGGNITIFAEDLQILNEGTIEANTTGSGDGGNIDITAKSILVDRQNSDFFTGIDAETTLNNGGGMGGDITIIAEGLRILNEGTIEANTTGSGDGGNIDIVMKLGDLQIMRGGTLDTTTFGSGDGGSINVDAKNIMMNRQNSDFGTGISSQTQLEQEGGGKAGNIRLNTDRLEIENGATIDVITFGSGNGGSINVDAKNIVIDGKDSFYLTGIDATSLLHEGGGNSGAIIITTDGLDIKKNASLDVTTFGSGAGGRINITAKNIVIDRQNSMSESPNGITAGTQLKTENAGPGGSITLTTETLDILNGGGISTNTFGIGDGGDLSVTAKNITIDQQSSQTAAGIGAQTQLESEGGGNGGNITLNTDNLRILNGGQVDVITSGSGNGGSIEITAKSIFIDKQNSESPTGISARTLLNGIGGGNGGDIAVSTENLEVINGGIVDATTFGGGDGGSISITSKSINLNRMNSTSLTGISAQTQFEPQGGGKGGDITLISDSLDIINGGVISAASGGTGNGGRINVSSGNIVIDKGDSMLPFTAGITAQTGLNDGGGKGGEILITSNFLQILNGGEISVITRGNGDAGNINISANKIVFNRMSADFFTGINAETLLETEGGGKGGNISITADNFQILNGGRISAITTGSGIGGSINITGKRIVVDGQNSDSPTGISAQSQLRTEDGGKGGEITFSVDELRIVNGGAIDSATLGYGDGGELNISAKAIVIDKQNADFFTGIAAQTLLADGGGKGGDVNISTTTLEVVNGGEISTSTRGSGIGGTLTITAESVLVDDQNSPYFTGITAETWLVHGESKGGILPLPPPSCR